MTVSEILHIAEITDHYNFHSHTEFCDGHAMMKTMAASALDCGMEHYGFSPHSPIIIDSPCNMKREDVGAFLDEVDRIREEYAGKSSPIAFYKGMEIDRLNHDNAPHIDYYQNLPLDYRIGSVHFVENQDGIFIDCDGGCQRFARNLAEYYRNDLRYVVEKYFESVLKMLEEGGFEILGHADKISANAFDADNRIEEYSWYEALIDDVVRLSKEKGVIVEVNTKAIRTRNRLFPAQKWLPKFVEADIPLIVNSDAHDPAKIEEGRADTIKMIRNLRTR